MDPSPEDLLALLRDTPGSWEAGMRQPAAPANKMNENRRWDAPRHHVTIVPSEGAASAPSAGLPVTTAAVADSGDYSFKMALDGIDTDAYTVDIHISYGEINWEPPAGMTSANDYAITIPGSADGTEFYAVITYDPATLAVTSRSITFDWSVPDSVLGTLNIPIGTVHITYDPLTGDIAAVTPHNRQCGDIVIAFVYGSANSAPALFTLRGYDDPVPLA